MTKLDIFVAPLGGEQQKALKELHTEDLSAVWKLAYRLTIRTHSTIPKEYLVASIVAALIESAKGALLTLSRANPAAGETLRKHVKEVVAKW